MPSLQGARIKLDRASEHLRELTKLARQYLDSRPFKITQNGVVYSVNIVRPVPTHWGAIVGDVVHNIRSALDLVAWQLVLAGGGTPSRDTAFPIQENMAALMAALPRTLVGASATALRFIRRLAPYKGANATLTRLHALDIADKHRVLLVVGAAHRNVVLNMSMRVPWSKAPLDVPPLAITPADRQFPLVDGAILYSGIPQDQQGALIERTPSFSFELALGDPGEAQGLPLIATLDTTLAHVRRIVDIGERFLMAPTRPPNNSLEPTRTAAENGDSNVQ